MKILVYESRVKVTRKNREHREQDVEKRITKGFLSNHKQGTLRERQGNEREQK